MSIRVTTRVWEQAQHNGTALLLLLALADMANDDGVCWPKVDQLAVKVRVDERQVRRLLRQLEAAGDLYVGGGGGRGRGSLYLVRVGVTPTDVVNALVHYFKLTPLEAQAIVENPDIQGHSTINPGVDTRVNKPWYSETLTSTHQKGDIQGQETRDSSRSNGSKQAPKRHDPSWEGGREDRTPANRVSEEVPTPGVLFPTETPAGRPSPLPPLPTAPAGYPPLTAQPLDLFRRSAARDPTEFEIRDLDRLARQYADGWYWIGRAIVHADDAGGLETKHSKTGWIRALIRRWATDGTWDSPFFEVVRPAPRQEQDHETSIDHRPGRAAVPAGQLTGTTAGYTPEQLAELRAKRLGQRLGGAPSGGE